MNLDNIMNIYNYYFRVFNAYIIVDLVKRGVLSDTDSDRNCQPL